MYISNSGNIGMATLLQQNKNCMKSITNGVGLVGSVVDSSVTGTAVATGTPVTLGGSSIILQQQQNSHNAAYVLTNGATGTATSNIITYQQYQQILQQQQLQQQQQQQATTAAATTRLLVPNDMVSFSIGSIAQSANNTLTVISSNSTPGGTSTSNTFLVSPTVVSSNGMPPTTSVNSFQQQFQQQIAAQQNQPQSQTIISTTAGLSSFLQQQGSVAKIVSSPITVSNNSPTVTRYFSQFSQSPANNVVVNNVAGSTANRPTHVLINRSNNTLISGGATVRRIQPATIVRKTVTAPASSTASKQLLPNSIVLNSSTPHQNSPSGQNVNNTFLNAFQQHTQQQQQRYGISTLQQIKQQQQQQLIQTQNQTPQSKLSATSTAVLNGIVTSHSGGVTAPVSTSASTTTTGTPILSNGTANGSDRSKAAASEVTVAHPSANEAGKVADEESEPEPEVDIVINNVVCSFSVRCHLNLRDIALKASNVEYRRENGMVTMKLRRPYTTASIWSSGRITCTGATSEEQSKIAARRYARILQNLGFRIRFHNFRVVNVLGTCSMPWAIKIVNFSEKYKKDASYEPELHPGVTYKLRFPKATLKIFSTGSITVTAASVANVQAAIEHIFPLVFEFRKKRSPEELAQLRQKQAVVPFDADENIEVLPPAFGMESMKRRSSVFNAGKFYPKRSKSMYDGGIEDEDVDNPEAIDEDNIILYSAFDDPEDLIEGPDDDTDDL